MINNRKKGNMYLCISECSACNMKVTEYPGEKYFKCLECDIVLCKVCYMYDQEVQLGEHSLAHDMRKMRKLYMYSVPSNAL